MHRGTRAGFRAWPWLLPLVWMACGGGGCGGCSCMQPIPGGYDGPTVDDAVVARVTAPAFDFVGAHYAEVLGEAGLSNPMSVPVPCDDVSFGSDGHLCDQNKNDRCDPGESCTIGVDVTQLSLAPLDPKPGADGVLEASARVVIDTGDMWVRTCAAEVFGACLCRLSCAANFRSTRSGQPYDELTAEVRFRVDTRYGRLLAFDVAELQGIDSLEGGDLDVRTSGVCSALACSALDLGFIKNYVLDRYVKPALVDQVRKAIDGARCRSCGGADDGPCPTPSTCQDGLCRDADGCAPVSLGTEGRLDLAQADVGGLSLPGRLDVFAMAGGSVSSQAQQHLTLGVIGGGQPFTGAGDGGVALRGPATCVPRVPEPTGDVAPAPAWSEVDAGYHVGVAVSSRYLEQLTWAAHQSGALCLDVGTAEMGQLTTELFEPFLPSLARFATVDGLGAPMVLALRPARPPHLTIGRGTVDEATGRPIDPLLRVDWPDVRFDVYAMIEERQFRLFSLTTDVSLPLALVGDGCGTVTPVLGDVRQLLVNVRAADSEMLAEDPQTLADLIPSLLALAESSLAKGLGSQTLPTFGNFRLELEEATGLTRATSGAGYEHLGLFTGLAVGACPEALPRVQVRASRVESPPAEALVATGAGLAWPTAVLSVEAPGAALDVTWAVRVDDGLWSDFRPAPGGELRVAHPALLLQGTHRVEVRARSSATRAVSPSTPVPVVVDYAPPRLKLRVDAEAGVVRPVAHDAVTPPERLRYSVRLGPGPEAPLEAGQGVSLERLDAAGGATVSVMDEAGHVSEATIRVPTVALRPEVEAAPAEAPSGCAVAPGAGWLALALAFVARRRRR